MQCIIGNPLMNDHLFSPEGGGAGRAKNGGKAKYSAMLEAASASKLQGLRMILLKFSCNTLKGMHDGHKIKIK